MTLDIPKMELTWQATVAITESLGCEPDGADRGYCIVHKQDVRECVCPAIARAQLAKALDGIVAWLETDKPCEGMNREETLAFFKGEAWPLAKVLKRTAHAAGLE